ncbi:hypothetical protein LJR009_005967 [Bosea sp. LjRoot9]|uniref:hypothetical protein n=1 Tax=Bosea sp. LjRoot9 TaxID=3342341 RepID=UPI003ECD5741
MTDSSRYQSDKRFLAYIVDKFMNIKGLPESEHPMQRLSELEKDSESIARKGLKQAIQDCIVMTSRLPPEKVSEIDMSLIEAGIPSLSEIRRRYWSKYKNLIKKDTISNDNDYYLAKGILDSGSPVPEDELKKLRRLIGEYEKI